MLLSESRAWKAVLSHPLVLVFSVCVGGVCCNRSWWMCPVWLSSCLPEWLPPLVLVSGLISALWCVWLSLHLRRQDAAGAVVLLMTMASCLSVLHHVAWRLYPAEHVVFRIPGSAERLPGTTLPAAVTCRVVSTPESSPLPEEVPLATIPSGVTTSFDAVILQLRSQSVWTAATGSVRVRVDGQLLGVSVGDEIQVFGDLSVPPAPLNPGEPDLAMASRTDRILVRLDVSYPDCVTKVRVGGWHPLNLIGRLRVAGLRLLDRDVGSARGALAGALLLGARDRLDPVRTQAFFHTGTIHLLAISGLHVGILASVFLLLARTSSANRRRILQALILLTIVYCFLTGLRAPVLRASILVQVLCVGMIWRRKVPAYNALAGAAIFVLLIRPADLFRPGAQLSFLAVTALIWFGRNLLQRERAPIERLVEKSRRWWQRALSTDWQRGQQLVVAGFAVWGITLPLVMLNFHLVSPIALVLNVLLSVPIALALMSGLGVLVFGGVLRPVAALCGWICDRCLAFVEGSVLWVHEIPGAYCWVAGPHPAWCAVFYGAVVCMAFVPKCRPTRRWAIALVCLWIALPVGLREWRSPPGKNSVRGNSVAAQRGVTDLSSHSILRCVFLAVGHGTCVVLELPDGRVVLYDSGRMGMPAPGARIVSNYLWHRGIGHLDAIVISHADADHYNIVPDLLQRFSVSTVYVSPVMFSKPTAGLRVLQAAIAEAHVSLKSLRADDVMQWGPHTQMHVLHPMAQGVAGSDNANSIVLSVEHGGKVLLLPGDLEARGLEHVVAEPAQNCVVLMAPHHGSLRSDPPMFTAWCTPDWSVISGGADAARNARQRQVYASSGSRVFHTAEDGAVTVLIDQYGVSVSSFLDEAER